MEVMVFQNPLTLGQKARMVRLSLRLRQSDVAARAGVPPQCVSQVERDAKVYPAARRRILQELGLEGET